MNLVEVVAPPGGGVECAEALHGEYVVELKAVGEAQRQVVDLGHIEHGQDVEEQPRDLLVRSLHNLAQVLLHTTRYTIHDTHDTMRHTRYTTHKTIHVAHKTYLLVEVAHAGDGGGSDVETQRASVVGLKPGIVGKQEGGQS